MVVYLIVNKINGKYYIGKTTGDLASRWSRHKYSARRPSNTSCSHLVNAIRKYGEDSFIPAVLAEAKSEQDLAQIERDFIFAYQSNNPTLGYNLTDGGEGSVGFHHTDETKKKLSIFKTGKHQPLSINTRRAISESNRKRVWSAEARQKIADSNRRRGKSK